MKEVWIWTITTMGFAILFDQSDENVWLLLAAMGCAFAGILALLTYLNDEGED